MADASQREITTAEVKRFLAGMHIRACAVCGHHGWRVEEEATSMSCRHACSDEKPREIPINVIVVVCQHCGLIELHDRSVIAHWLDCHQGK